ncbi:MAG: AbrB/MazE/SpoVT family DNA-binding domain-containing protein [Fimbriimonadales bacterium]
MACGAGRSLTLRWSRSSSAIVADAIKINSALAALRPHGPHTLTTTGQVSIPKQVRQLVGLDVGSAVYFAEDPRVPGLLVVIPLSQLANWLTGRKVGLASAASGTRRRSHPS